MRKNRKVRWTPEDDELLRSLVIANVTPFEIAAKLERSVAAVKNRAHQLRIALGKLKLK